MLILTIRPVAPNELGPAPITFPCIKRRVNAGAPTAGCGYFGYPLAVLLPAIRFRFFADLRTGLAVVRVRILFPFGATVTVPGAFFAVLHMRLPCNSFVQMLRDASARAQELLHNAGSRFFL